MTIRIRSALAALLVAALPALAQDYPTKPIKVVVPYAPGGGADILARLVGQELSQRVKQPVGVVCLQIRCDALRTQSAFIHREFVTRLDANDAIFLDQQFHSALHTAVWTMCIHYLVDHPIGLPSAVRGIMQMRTEAFYYLI